MAEITRILVPLDLHGLSEAKLPVASAQARAFGAELILLHVLAPEPASEESASPAEAQARTYLDALAARLRTEGIAARPLLRWGAPVETILNEIGTEGVDLVILGRSTRHGVARLVLGSVAAAISARAACPVLLVGSPSGTAAPQPAVRSFGEDAARAGALAPRELGLRTVEVARIVGSVGRAEELDARFRSRQRSRSEDQRFATILKLQEEGPGLPPVSLYKLGYGYYVLDGNHRVAAARQLGQLEIEAHVTEFVSMGDTQAQRVATERRAFEQATGRRRIGAVVPGHYARLTELIRAYAQEQGMADLRDAATQWETRVYRPVARQIRVRRLSQRFPGERTADIFVRVAECREEARRAGEPLDWSQALAHLAGKEK